MEITVSESLKEFRNKKGNKQEDLADYLGISFQAVSKWERNEGFPDITLLPKIAAYYDVSVDDLLGVGKIREEEKINEYWEKSKEFSVVGNIDSEVALWKEAAHEFPNNLRVLNDYMSAMWNKNKRSDDPNEYADDIIKIGERILKEAVDDEWRRYSAIQVLCYIHARIGNKEKAKEYAGKAPIYMMTMQELCVRALEGEEAVNQIQRNIMDLTDMIHLNICQELKRKKEFNNDEKRYMYNYVLNLFKLLFSDGDFGFYYDRTNGLYLELAKCDAFDDDLEGTINNLTLAAEHAINYDTLEDGKEYTSFLVNRQKHHRSGTGSNSNGNESYYLLTHLKDKEFDFCRDDIRFNAIQEKLNEYAQARKW